MPKADWRSPEPYEDRRSLDAPGFAWEFLARNDEFQRARRKLDRAAEHKQLDPNDADVFAREWGVQFRGDVRERHRPAPGVVDPGRAADGHTAYRPSA